MAAPTSKQVSDRAALSLEGGHHRVVGIALIAINDVSFSVLGHSDWFNNRRLFGPIGNVPPAEFEAMYDRQEGKCATGAAPN